MHVLLFSFVHLSVALLTVTKLLRYLWHRIFHQAATFVKCEIAVNKPGIVYYVMIDVTVIQ